MEILTKKGGRDSSESLPKSIDRVPNQQDDFNPIHSNSQQSRAFIVKALPEFLADLRLKGWVIKDYVRRTFNAASHIPEELKGFEDCFEWDGEYLVIYVPRVIYRGEDEEKDGKTERLLPDFLEPWHRYPVEDIQSVLDPKSDKPETTADERTIRRWKEKWKAVVSELKRKAGEEERKGIAIRKLPDGIMAATKEIITRLGGRWFSRCYVMAYLSKPSRWTNLDYPPFISLKNLFGEVASNCGGKTDAEGERQA